MSARTTRVWCAAAIAGCLIAAMPGCYIRRGFAVHWNWTLHAHRYGCHGAACCGDEPLEMASGPGECVDCLVHDESHGVGQGRAAEGPPPLDAELTPDPEPAGPSYFHPVPTRPVFGPRSEQPDGIDGQTLIPLPAPAQEAQPMMPLLPAPDAGDSKDDDTSIDEPPSDAAPDPSSSTRFRLRRLPKGREAKLTGWKAASTSAARKRTIRSTPPAEAHSKDARVRPSGDKKKRPCPHCSLSFKPRARASGDSVSRRAE